MATQRNILFVRILDCFSKHVFGYQLSFPDGMFHITSWFRFIKIKKIYFHKIYAWNKIIVIDQNSGAFLACPVFTCKPGCTNWQKVFNIVYDRYRIWALNLYNWKFSYLQWGSSLPTLLGPRQHPWAYIDSWVNVIKKSLYASSYLTSPLSFLYKTSNFWAKA